MAIEQLQIKIGADVNGVVQAVSTVNNSVGKLKFSLDDLQQKLKAKQNLLITETDIKKIEVYKAEVIALRKQIEATKSLTLPSIGGLSQSTSGFQNLTSGVSTAFSALRKLAYILPGIGIAGLIGQFTELAVTVFNGGNVFDFFSGKLHTSKKSVADHTKELKEAKQALDDYVDSLDDISKIKITGAQDAQKELGALETLYTASQNLSLSYGERKKAVDLLQERYPAYFANLSDEAILAGKAKGQYEKLTTAILAASTARAAQKELDTLAEQARVIKQQREEAEKTAKVKDEDFQKRLAQNQKEIAIAKKIGESTLALENGISEKQNEKVKSQNSLNALRAKENDLLNRQKKISDEIQGLVKDNGVDVLKTSSEAKPDSNKAAIREAKKELEKALKERKAVLDEFVRDFDTIKIPFPKLSKPFEDFNAGELRDELRDKLNKALTGIAPLKIKIPVDPIIGIDLKKIPIPLKPTIVWKDTDLHGQLEDFARVGNQIGESLGHGFGDVFQKIFEQSLTDAVLKGMSGQALENFKGGLAAVAVVTADAFNGLGDAFGNLTSSLLKGENGIKAFGESLKNTFSQLAAQLIKTIALAAILSLITGGAGNAAKGGLSFLGSFKKLLGFAKGGPVPGVGSGDTVPAMLTPGEFVVTKDKAPFVASLLKSMGSLKMPKLINGSYHFAQGGFVPNIERTSPVQRINNIINPTPVQFPDYLPVIQYSYDSMRIGYQRANKAKTIFGG
jgi:hypothetical protein